MVHLIKYASQSFWHLFEATKAISKGILLKSSIPILEPLVAYCSGLEIKVQPRLNKFVLLCLEAYNSGLEAGIGTCRDIFGFLRFSAFI